MGSPVSARTANHTWSSSRMWYWGHCHLGPGSGRGMLTTSFAPTERSQWKNSRPPQQDSTYHQTVEVEEDRTLLFLETLARRREDGGLTSLSTGNLHTQTGTSTSNPTTQHMWRVVLWSVSTTGPGGSSAHRTTLRRKWSNWLKFFRQNGHPANFICSTSAPPPSPQALYQ